MKTLFPLLARKFASLRRTFLHALCISSIVAVVLGWLLLDRFGPIGVILPVAVAIGACLSEIDRLMEPGYARRPRRRMSDRSTA